MIRARRSSDRAALVELVVTRLPEVDEQRVASMLDGADRVIHLDLVDRRDGAVVAWGCTFTRPGMPGVVFERVLVCAAVEGHGFGGRLHARLLRELPHDVNRLRGVVFDTEQRALDVVRHWGYQPYELCHVSRLELAGETVPTLVPDLTVEACPDLRFADHDAVLAMLDRAETNPERAHGLFVTLDMMRSFAADGTQLGFLGRVAGAPVGLVHGYVNGNRMLITYLCVDPAYRGRGIALALKENLHAQSRRLGATHVITGNEDANVAVRGLNARLGYRRLFGEVRIERLLPTKGC